MRALKISLNRRLRQLGLTLAAAAWMSAAAAADAPEGKPSLSPEVADAATQVLAHEDWQALASRCPATFLAHRDTPDPPLKPNDCQSGQLKACLARCTAGTAESCYRLAYALQMAGTQPQASEVLYQRACQLGIVSGCTNRAAGLSVDREQDPAAQACATQTFAKACALEDPWGCTMHALHLSRGIGTPRDTKLALKVLSKSCKYGPADEACTYGQQLKQSLLDEAREETKGRAKKNASDNR